jgi:hypothetical protein
MQTGEFHSLLIFKKLRGEHSGIYACTPGIWPKRPVTAPLFSFKVRLPQKFVPKWKFHSIHF